MTRFVIYTSVVHSRLTQSIDLEGNHLEVLPGSFNQLAALQTSHLKRNQLNIFPESVGQLVALWMLRQVS